MDNKQILRLLSGDVVDYDPKPVAGSQSIETPSSGNFSPKKLHKHSIGHTIGSPPPSLSKVPKAQKLIMKMPKRARITKIVSDVSNFRAIVQQYTGLNSPLHYTAHHSTRIQKAQKEQNKSEVESVEAVKPHEEKKVSSRSSAFDVSKYHIEMEVQSNENTSNWGALVCSFECLSNDKKVEKKGSIRVVTNTLPASEFSISNNLGVYTNELVHLSLAAYPSRSPSISFHAEFFAELNFSCSNFSTQPWLGRQRLSSLRVFDFSNTKLMNLPDLSEAKHLRTLVLQHCTNLVEVSSIQYLTNLKCLNLKGCTSLRSLPSLMNLKLLHSLDLSYCSNLIRLPLSIGCLSSLTALDLKACKRLQNLPLSTVKLKSLQALNISGCLKLVKLISDIGMGKEHLKRRPQVPSSSLERELQSNISEAIMLAQNVAPICSESSALLEGKVGSYVTNYKALPLLERIVTKIDPQATRQISTGSGDGTKTSLTVASAITLVESEPAKNFQLKEPKTTAIQVATHKETQKPLKNRDSRTQPLKICDLQELMRKMESYIDMSVEEIHQLDVFGNVEKIIHTLFGQTSYFKEWTNIEQIISFLEELKNNIPHTMFSVQTARNYKILLEGKLMQLGVSLDEAEKQYKVLDTGMIMLCEEEAKLEVEIQTLLARREELLDQRISHASC